MAALEAQIYAGAAMIAPSAPSLAACETVSDHQVDALVAFLKTLTDDSARDLSHVIPDTVPSGLPIF